jgi:hypothetical protein
MAKRFWMWLLAGLAVAAVVALWPGGPDVTAAQFTVPTRTPTPLPAPTGTPVRMTVVANDRPGNADIEEVTTNF